MKNSIKNWKKRENIGGDGVSKKNPSSVACSQWLVH